MIASLLVALSAAGDRAAAQIMQDMPIQSGTPWVPIMAFAGGCILIGAGGANFFRAKGIKEVAASTEIRDVIDARIDHKARNSEQVISMKFELFANTLKRMEKSMERQEKMINNLRIRAALNDAAHDSVHGNDNDETDVDA